MLAALLPYVTVAGCWFHSGFGFGSLPAYAVAVAGIVKNGRVSVREVLPVLNEGFVLGTVLFRTAI